MTSNAKNLLETVQSTPVKKPKLAWAPSPLVAVAAAVVVVLIAVLSVWPDGRSHAVPATAAPVASAATTATVKDGDGETHNNSQIVVHVIGAVKTPGLIKLSEGARVAQAISEAGGPTDNADMAQINLARQITDGEQIQVPAIGTVPAEKKTDALHILNSGNAALIEELPGIGPALAKRIVADHKKRGQFRSINDLTRVSGIGAALIKKIAG